MGILTYLDRLLGDEPEDGDDDVVRRSRGPDDRQATPGGDGPVIEADDLRYVYPDDTVGLDGVNLTLRRGERVAVVGPNGSGKSTLQLALGGLVEPAAG